jgi:hypothetical protein
MGADRSRPKMTALVAWGACAMWGAAVLVPPTASAKPAVTMSAAAAPIPMNPLEPHSRAWAHTGNMARAGAELEATFTITGTEYLGLPNPLRRVMIALPKGIKVTTRGFASCRLPHGNWRKTGEAPLCTQKAYAGAVSEVLGAANIGGSNLPVQFRQGAFFTSSGGGLGFWSLNVSNWLSGEGLLPATLKPADGGYKLTENLPPFTAAGVTDISTESITVALGAAYKQGGKLVSYLTMPTACPTGGYPVKAELSFGAGAESSWETVAVALKEACTKG